MENPRAAGPWGSWAVKPKASEGKLHLSHLLKTQVDEG